MSVQIGQAGAQIGNSIWELFCAEHGIGPSGYKYEGVMREDGDDSFFYESMKGKFVPRSVIADLEPTVIDEIRSGVYRHLHHPNNLISGKEDAASNFSRGYFTVGKQITEELAERTRGIFEACEMPSAICFYRSIGGGTGSSITAALFDFLADYVKTTRIEISVVPSPTLSSVIVEPYNAVLAQHYCMDDVDLCILLDNESIYDILKNKYKSTSTTFTNVNQTIAFVLSSLTCTTRHSSMMDISLNSLSTNLVPYPRIHYPLVCFSPMDTRDRLDHEDPSVSTITNDCFDTKSQLLSIDRKQGKILSSTFIYRGDIPISYIYPALIKLKARKDIKFVDWNPTEFKIGISNSHSVATPNSMMSVSNRSCFLLCNNSCIGQSFQTITSRFSQIYSKRSFVHWFIGEGLEEGEMNEALFNIAALVKDYEEICKETIPDLKEDPAEDEIIEHSEERKTSPEKIESEEEVIAIESQKELNESRQIDPIGIEEPPTVNDEPENIIEKDLVDRTDESDEVSPAADD